MKANVNEAFYSRDADPQRIYTIAYEGKDFKKRLKAFIKEIHDPMLTWVRTLLWLTPKTGPWIKAVVNLDSFSHHFWEICVMVRRDTPATEIAKKVSRALAQY
jgi:hypothetical protein